MKTPTPEAIERVLARLGKPGANTYFFDKLNNPAWVEPLYKRGFFQRPPGADRSRNDGTVSFSDWPELRYLERMATLVPQTVGPIAVTIPDTDNSRVRELQLQIGRLLGREDGQKLADRAIEWLDDAITLRNFAEPFAHFIMHLLELGEVKRALRLTRRLFASAGADESPVRAQLDEWHYERYLKICLPALRDRAGLQTLGVLRDLLLDSARAPGEGQSEDFSYIWRRDLLRANFTVKQITDILIDAVRDTALYLAQRADVGFEPVKTLLLARNRLILTRVVIFVAAQVCHSDDPFVLETLLDTRLVDRFTCRVEYTALLRAMFPKMSQAAQQRILEAMAREPLQTIPESKQQELAPERLAQLRRVVRRDRLSAFGAALPAGLTAERDVLVADLGESHAPSAPTIWHGPTGPVTSESLERMPFPELLSYLARWAPTHEFGAPSREGLARDLQRLAKERALDWSTDARAFEGLNPTYVRGVILGLNDASTARMRLDWAVVLDLLRWVMAQPRQIVTDNNALDEGEDPDWSWTRQAIARLLTTGLTTPENEIEFGLRNGVWMVLDELLKDPDPVADADPAEDRDPLTTSINSVRGTAGHAVFRFAWWIHKHLSAPDAGAELRFDRMPEVKTGIERMLADPSPAMHSVLGDWFRTMFFFDARWTEENIDGIFPEAPESRPYWLATWRAFADYDQPYEPAFAVLKPKYVFAVDQLADASEELRKKMGEAGLGQHLTFYYWRGVGGDETRGLLLRYFERCSSTAAAHALWSIGGGLEGAEPIAPATISALMRLWTDLSTQAAGWPELKRREVYRQFGRWFSSGRFDNRWALLELKRALDEGAGMLDVEDVLARLEALSREYSREVADIVETLLQDERQLWQPLIWKSQVESLVRALLNSDDEAARQHAERIVNQLVENGSLFARDLLPRATAAQTATPSDPAAS